MKFNEEELRIIYRALKEAKKINWNTQKAKQCRII